MEDIIVVGAGHAGCEAAVAAARKGKKTLLITSNIAKVADLPCNPSIGGSAKGIVVREIDALGGIMGELADQSQIQMKKLNIKKGPAVQAYRAQIDKDLYYENMWHELKKHKNLTVYEGMVEDLIVEKQQVKGVKTEHAEFFGKAVILTTGTYLKADILIGETRKRSGPDNQKPSLHLSDNLRKLGFEIIRLKTGTPPRVDKETIAYELTTEEKGSDKCLSFSNFFPKQYDIEKQAPCYLTYTNAKTHEIIRKNINKSSMYGGIVDLESVGPRYCPSIEDKIMRFDTKERHQLFLEPVSLSSPKVYIQGLSTSFPLDVQEKIVRSIKGLENCRIITYAYAIEYDAVNPQQLKQSLETKLIKNLFMAGINACLALDKKQPFILKRNEAYIGVLIDDLVTKGVLDPYRLLTSRAEYRLLLRNDNADQRLTPYGIKYQLLNKEAIDIYEKNQAEMAALVTKLKNTYIYPKKETNDYLEQIKSSPIKDRISLYNLLKRSEIKLVDLAQWVDIDAQEHIKEKIVTQIKYEGYIKKAQKEAEKMLKLEKVKIPPTIDYSKIHNIASEAKQKLSEVKPTTLGQANRISGVNPSDIAILSVYIKGRKNEE